MTQEVIEIYKVINYSGFVKYKEGLSIQEAAFQKVLNDEYRGILIILEHFPVYTMGADGGWDNLLKTKEFLNDQGIDYL